MNGSETDIVFTPSRLVLARQRRATTQKALAEAVGVSVRSIKAYEGGEVVPSADNLKLLARFLGFPVGFFQAPKLECLEPQAASFRALTKASAAVRDRAVASGTFALEVHRAISERYQLPTQNVPDLRDVDPARAADTVRYQWGLGQKPIANVVHQLEFNGVRVFSLAEDCDAIDAFSIWRDGVPFVFLNTRKTAERSIFDAAHELGHLVLHRHGTPQGHEAERQADEFASNFLLPEQAMRSIVVRMPTIANIAAIKRTWRASAAAIARRLYSLGQMSEWSYRNFNIELARRGRANEPMPIERETSAILLKTIGEGADLFPPAELAKTLCVPISEIRAVTFGLQVIDGLGAGEGGPRGKLRLLE